VYFPIFLEAKVRRLVLTVLLAWLTASFAVAPVGAEAASKGGKRVAAAAKRYKSVRQAAKKSGFVKVRARPAQPKFEVETEGSVLNLRAQSALVIEKDTGQIVYAKNSHAVQPIASLTKLMTAITVLETNLPLEGSIRIEYEDMDSLRGTRSHLRVGEVLPRADLMRLALMASENSAAAALARSHPGGTAAFVAEMNRLAGEIGLSSTRFTDSTGLSAGNVANAQDLAKLVAKASSYALIREYSTTPSLMLTQLDTGREIAFRNTNRLVRDGEWTIHLSKTGFINEAGQCLVMNAQVLNRDLIIVLLDSHGHLGRIGDANRVKRWLENNESVLLSARYES
jgi:serine-type D-Ala-D-Ala endopeptidase (penicillin-binding protein 7)